MKKIILFSLFAFSVSLCGFAAVDPTLLCDGSPKWDKYLVNEQDVNFAINATGCGNDYKPDSVYSQIRVQSGRDETVAGYGTGAGGNGYGKQTPAGYGGYGGYGGGYGIDGMYDKYRMDPSKPMYGRPEEVGIVVKK
ncbi:MAG: hypothetical protein LBO08_01475 [Rickettsiales bacterium]|jgi:hypothetical protein|nr:hypothetical protein [Rickettsiales bacterium]